MKSVMNKVVNNNNDMNNEINPNDLLLNNFKSAFNSKNCRADKI